MGCQRIANIDARLWVGAKMTLRTQLDDALRRVRDLEQEVAQLKEQSKPRIDIPPHWLIQASKQALGRTGKWNDCYNVLTTYYGIPRVRNLVDDSKIPKGADGVYYQNEKTVYGKQCGMSTWIAMHEFAHHLCAHLMPIGGEAEQAFCNSFATEMEKNWT